MRSSNYQSGSLGGIIPPTNSTASKYAAPYSKKQLIEQIKALALKLGRTPKAKDVDVLSKQGLMASRTAFATCFGSWNNAVKAAELELVRGSKYSESLLIGQLKKLAERLKRNPTSGDVDRCSRGEIASSRTFMETFGVWNEVLKAAGFEVIEDFSKEGIILQIKNLAKSLGRTPTFKSVKDSALIGKIADINMIVKVFGTWNKALLSAGLVVNNVRAYSRDALITQIKTFTEAIGKTPSIPDLKRTFRTVIASETAFYKWFGSWKNALKESGLEPDMKGGEWKDKSLLKPCIPKVKVIPLPEIPIERLSMKEMKKLLTAQEEKDLSRQVKKGNARAREHFGLANLRLVYSIANKHKSKISENSLFTYNDIVQEGYVGLMVAIEKFDPDLGYKFSTYATWWINQAIDRAMKDKNNLIRVPVNKAELVAKYKKASLSFFKKHGNFPNDHEMAILLNVTIDKVVDAKGLIEILNSNNYYGLDSPISGREEGLTYEDVIPDHSTLPVDSEIDLLSLRDKIFKSLDEANLTKQEKEIIMLRFGFKDGSPRTLEEIGQMFDLSRERIRQIEKIALNKIRLLKSLEELKVFFDELEGASE